MDPTYWFNIGFVCGFCVAVTLINACYQIYRLYHRSKEEREDESQEGLRGDH